MGVSVRPLFLAMPAKISQEAYTRSEKQIRHYCLSRSGGEELYQKMALRDCSKD